MITTHTLEGTCLLREPEPVTEHLESIKHLKVNRWCCISRSSIAFDKHQTLMHVCVVSLGKPVILGLV